MRSMEMTTFIIKTVNVVKAELETFIEIEANDVTEAYDLAMTGATDQGTILYQGLLDTGDLGYTISNQFWEVSNG